MSPRLSVRRRLAAMTDAELLTIVPADASPAGAWGASGSAIVDGETIFLKRIPLTDLEAARPYSTRNHFRLPTYYSYGVGSAGFGVWRELAVHETTADRDGFPRLLHHRVMRRTAPPPDVPWTDAEYLHKWNDNAAIGRFMDARRAATHEVWIALEYVPHAVYAWLPQHQEHIDEVLAQVFDAIAELHALGVVHFDTHFGNVVTDGERCRVGDFGLSLSLDFELTSAERAFHARHAHYDYGVVFMSMAIMLSMAMTGSPGGAAPVAQIAGWLDDVENLPVSYHPNFAAALRRYREPIVFIADFFERIRRPSKRARFDDAAFAAVLRDAGVPLG